MGIECVSKPECESSAPNTNRRYPGLGEVRMGWGGEREQRDEAEHMQARHRRDHRRQRPPLASAQRCPETGIEAFRVISLFAFHSERLSCQVATRAVAVTWESPEPISR